MLVTLQVRRSPCLVSYWSVTVLELEEGILPSLDWKVDTHGIAVLEDSKVFSFSPLLLLLFYFVDYFPYSVTLLLKILCKVSLLIFCVRFLSLSSGFLFLQGSWVVAPFIYLFIFYLGVAIWSLT